MTPAGLDAPSKANPRFSERELDGLKEAIIVLDALWEFDAALGKADSLGGCEYWHRAPAVPLREMLGEQPRC